MMLWHLLGIITWQLLRTCSTAPENEHSISYIWLHLLCPSETDAQFCFIVFASLPVSTRATVVTNYVLLSIAEPSAESSIPTSIVLHFWIIACRWENNYKHIPVHNSDQIFLCSSLQWSHINRLWISYAWFENLLHCDSLDLISHGKKMCMSIAYPPRLWTSGEAQGEPSSLPSCLGKKSFQTLLWTSWCCIYTAFKPRGRSPLCPVQNHNKQVWLNDGSLEDEGQIMQLS